MDSPISPELLKTLQDIVGHPYVLTPQSEKMEDFRKDMGDFQSEPLLVLQPDGPEQVSAILKILNSKGISVVARGAGTSLTGATSTASGVVIDFSKRMNRIFKIDTTNWYVHCEAGVVIDDLNEQLSKQGFFFPPDPASAPWCTVGGVISENSGGMRTFRYGTVKDWVLALQVVLADGSLLKIGEPLPKNRVGYDLVHLICGSEGTLALVTNAWLKIAPRLGTQGNQQVKKFMVFFSNWNDAVSSIIALRSQGVQPNFLEFISKEAMNAVNQAFDTRIPEHEGILFMEAHVSMVEQVIKICSENGSVESYVGKNEQDDERLYNSRALLLLGIKSLGSGVLNEDMVVPLDKLATFLDFVKNTSVKYGLRIPTAGHAGDGNVHPTIVFDANSEESREKATKAFNELTYEAVRLGGSVTGEHGIGIQKLRLAREQLLERNGPKALDLMLQMKKLWDPKNILNPGKFITDSQ
jgi:glycolate oxidase